MQRTQAAFALEVGVSQPSQANYERGARSPSIDYLARAARLGVDLEFVVRGHSSQPRLTSNTDLDLLEELIVLVENCSQTRPFPLSPEAKARLIKLLLPLVVEWQEVRENEVAAFVRLAA